MTPRYSALYNFVEICQEGGDVLDGGLRVALLSLIGQD